MFSRKANPLTFTQSENYSFVASLDKISSNDSEICLLKFSIFLGVSKPPKNLYGKKKVDLVHKKYDVLLNTGLILRLRKFSFQKYITLSSLGQVVNDIY